MIMGTSRQRVRQIESRLGERYGAAEKPRVDPLDELIHTILSQNTSDTNRDRAWSSLREEYGSWEEVLEDGAERLERTIRVAGLAQGKAATILRALRWSSDGGSPSLERLRTMSDEEALRYLTAIKGVGTKTAACVLCFSLGRPVMPVDTHVHRVSRRLGLVPDRATPERAYEVLNEIVPPELRFSLHLQLIRHGRETCRSRTPACPGCVLLDLCPRVGLAGTDAA